MKTIVEGVFSGHLPWRLVFSGCGAAICGMLLGANGLAFGIGVYLPLATMAPIYVGGCVRAVVDRTRGGRPIGENDAGVLAASGLVAGERSGRCARGRLGSDERHRQRPSASPYRRYGQAAVALLALLICGFLWWACRKKPLK